MQTEWEAGCAALCPEHQRGDGAGAVSAPAPRWPPPALDFCEEPLMARLHAQLPALHAQYGLRHAIDEGALPAAAEALERLAASCATSGSDGASARGGEAFRALQERLGDASCAGLILKPTLAGGLEAGVLQRFMGALEERRRPSPRYCRLARDSPTRRVAWASRLS